MKNAIALLSLALCLACSSGAGSPAAAGAPAKADAASAAEFATRAEREFYDQMLESGRMEWVNNTYITDDTNWLNARSTERSLALQSRLIQEAARYKDVQGAPAEVKRKIDLMLVSPTLPAPTDAAAQRELATLATDMNALYGKGRWCPAGASEKTVGVAPGEDGCLDIGKLTKLLAEVREYDKLLAAWEGWHEVGKPMREKFARFVQLANEGSRSLGFANTGELWKARYDMTPAEFEAETERLWAQVKPFYEALHCYVRAKLTKHYGEAKVPKTGPIPAHLLGNMWAQAWSNIYPLVEPYPGMKSLDVTARMTAQKWDALKLMKTGEAFFTSLGMPQLPASFWERSMITQPRDREVVCHASAWDMDTQGDVRVKMCTEVNEEDLETIHHELGHIYYYLMYNPLDLTFEQGANDGFHEGIGDTLVLSMTPQYLKQLGLLDAVQTDAKSDMNALMKRALDKVAFLPFGKLVDQWRWQVFDGRVPPEQYNAAWWKLRTQYQGIAPASSRTEAHFDPGAKYHVPANTPYTRYFLAHILQFQFHRALCRAAGHTGPLHTCSIYGSKEAGEKLMAMLKMGASKPWPEALAAISGETTMDASALAEYFAPLKTFLDEQNKGQTCGW